MRGVWAMGGGAGKEIGAGGDEPQLTLENDGKHAQVSCGGDCSLRVPEDATLVIDTVGGDAKITDISGLVTMNIVGGDLVLRDTGPITISKIGGDLVIKRTEGDAEVQLVGGDANLRQIGGDLNIALVGGDVSIYSIKGNCDLESIGGDLIFNTNFATDARYHLTVGGDVLGKVAADANVRFVIPPYTETSIQIPNAEQQKENDHTVVVVGSGAAEVEFGNIGGDLELISTDGMDKESESIYESFFPGDPGDLADIISARVNEPIAPLLDRVKRRTERMQRQAERTADRGKNQSEGHGRGWGFGWWGGTEKPKRGFGSSGSPGWPGGFPEKEKREPATGEPVTNEERMAILQMVENKQISIEEAEKLLTALENTD